MFVIDKPKLTIAEAAAVAGVAARTVERWIKNGRVEAVKVAGATLVLRESLEELLTGTPVKVAN